MFKQAIYVKSIVNNLTTIRTLFLYKTSTIIIIILSLLIVQITNVLSDHIMNFSGATYTHVAYESWRPCLNGYVRFDIQTKALVGTLAYIDDKGKYDFFYLKLVEGKLRLLFNLGSERQALNVEYEINDNYWHTIEIRRYGRITSLIVDNGKVQNSTITEKEDLYFGGSTANEYQSSLFYFGGIPTMLERHNYGNLSSYDVYLQPRFKGKMRNIVYKNCTKKLVKPVQQRMEGVSLIDDNNCNHSKCKHGICMITDDSYWCLCDETLEGLTCENKKKSNALTFKGKQYLSYKLINPIESYDNETLSFEFKTNKQYGLLFYGISNDNENQRFLICFERGHLLIEYRLNSNVSLEWRPILTSTGLTNSLITPLTNGGSNNELISTTIFNWNNGGNGGITLSDDKWHLLRITRRQTVLDLILDDEYHVTTTHDQSLKGLLKIKQIYLGGTINELERSMCNYKFQGCLKNIIYSIENRQLDLTKIYLNNESSIKINSYGNIIKEVCETIMESITFLTSNSYLTIDLINDTKWNKNYDEQIELSFRTIENHGVLFYAIGTSNKLNQSFFGLDLFDGFLYLTINIDSRRRSMSKRREITNRRYNDGNQHHIRIFIRYHTGGLDISIFIDQENEVRFSIVSKYNKLHLNLLIIGGIDPSIQMMPNDFWSGTINRGFIGCISDFELTGVALNLTHYVLLKKLSSGISRGCIENSGFNYCQPSLCLNGGECQISWNRFQCDCSKTSYTGYYCEQAAYQLEIEKYENFEINTELKWTDEINDITFRLKANYDQENFFSIRPCSITSFHCDEMLNFSIKNGLLEIRFMLKYYNYINITNSRFILDQKWHFIRFQRFDQKILFYVDDNVKQTEIKKLIIENDIETYPKTKIWLRFLAQKIKISNLLINRYSIFSNRTIKLKPIRYFKPQNPVSLIDNYSYFTLNLANIFGIYFELITMSFDFRTIDKNGLIFYANIQMNEEHDENDYSKKNYFKIQLINGQIQLKLSLNNILYEINSKLNEDINDGKWHQLSFYRIDIQQFQLILDTIEYSLFIGEEQQQIRFKDKLYFGKPPITLETISSNDYSVKLCLASLSVNHIPINLMNYRYYGKTIITNCNLNKATTNCPTKKCRNNGRCTNQTISSQLYTCDCKHTSFNGRYCMNMKRGYRFYENGPGITFDVEQLQRQHSLVNDYHDNNHETISFGILTKVMSGCVLRTSNGINTYEDYLQIDIYQGRLKVLLIFNNQDEREQLINDQEINDGKYHLVVYKRTYSSIRLQIDRKITEKQLSNKITNYKIRKRSVYLGYNTILKQGFQGLLYGFAYDIYNLFDLISPTFQHINFRPSSMYNGSSFLVNPPDIDNRDNLLTCDYNFNDDFCDEEFETNLFLPNVTLKSLLDYYQTTTTTIMTTYTFISRSKTLSSNFFDSRVTTRSMISSISLDNQNISSISDSNTDVLPPLVSPRSKIRSKSKFNIWLIIAPVSALLVCLIILFIGYIKYRRKDVGTYQVEEAQRFRPLIIELQNDQNSPTNNISSSQNHKKKTSKKKKKKRIGVNENKEWYI